MSTLIFLFLCWREKEQRRMCVLRETMMASCVLYVELVRGAYHTTMISFLSTNKGTCLSIQLVLIVIQFQSGKQNLYHKFIYLLYFSFEIAALSGNTRPIKAKYRASVFTDITNVNISHYCTLNLQLPL